MTDKSFLDSRYFVDNYVYNCPFCNRNNVMYSVVGKFHFNWSEKKACHAYVVRCDSCSNRSMHLSYKDIDLVDISNQIRRKGYRFSLGDDLKDTSLDNLFFYSVPTSFFTLDERVPRILRELLTEAEGCLKGNFLTGASACARKIIYELAVLSEVDDESYEERIKSLKKKYTEVEPTYFDNLLAIQRITSSKVHENAYDGWTSGQVRLILASIREVLHELYVVPAMRADRRQAVIELQNQLLKNDSSRTKE